MISRCETGESIYTRCSTRHRVMARLDGPEWMVVVCQTSTTTVKYKCRASRGEFFTLTLCRINMGSTGVLPNRMFVRVKGVLPNRMFVRVKRCSTEQKVCSGKKVFYRTECLLG